MTKKEKSVFGAFILNFAVTATLAFNLVSLSKKVTAIEKKPAYQVTEVGTMTIDDAYAHTLRQVLSSELSKLTKE